MYLKRLEIQGFKSFADKVEFEFPGGITAIVGPNGSGKSNVVDSIRWVLGEQSAKSLRGGKMDDVIFAGSADRRAVGMAQVSLTLDNSAGLFALDYEEVTISRRLYRSGESEYLINKAPCRLKDIHELFMDTGLGREGFSVISQGKVDEILSLKPEDRRGLIEEAAGIIKYKYRKKEAEKKLDDTEENLVRIYDITSELEERVGPLAEQAQKAQRYHIWKTQLDGLEITLEVDDLEKNNALERQLETKHKGIEDEVAEKSAEHSKFDARLIKEKIGVQQHEDELSQRQQEFYQLQNQFDKKQTEIQSAQEMKGNFEHQRQQLLADIHYYANDLAQLAAEKLAKEQLVAQLGQDAEQDDDLLNGLKDGLQDKNHQKTIAEQRLEQLKDDHLVNLQAQAKSHNDLLRLEQELQNNDRRKARIDEKANRLRSEQQALQGQLTKIVQRKQVVSDELQEKQQHLNDDLKKLSVFEQDFQQISEDLEQYKNSFQQTTSKYQALKDLEESGDGYQVGVKAILEQKKGQYLAGVVGTVAQLIKVPDYLEKAIETVMGASLQNIVMTDDKAAQKAIQYLKTSQKGRATFLPMNTVKGNKANERLNDANVLGLAVDLVEFEVQYQPIMNYLLGRVWIVKDLDSAVNLGKQKGFSHRLVTLDGDLITPGGALTGGNYAKQKSSLLSRQRQIDELGQLSQQLKVAIADKSQRWQAKEAEISQLRQQLEGLKEGIHQLHLQLSEVAQQQAQLHREVQRVTGDLDLEVMDLQDLSHQTGDVHQAIDEAKAQSAIIETQKDHLEQQLTLVQQQFASLTVEMDELNQQLGEQNLLLATKKQRQSSTIEQLEQITSRLAQGLALQQQKQDSEQKLGQQIADKETEIAQGKENLERWAYEIHEKNQLLSQLKEQKTVMQADIDQIESDLKQNQKQLDQLKNDNYAAELELSRIRTKIELGVKRLAQNFDCTLEEAQLRKITISDHKEAAKQVSQLKSNIQSLGNINFTAVEEHQQVEERLHFLTVQVNDLVEAKQALNKIIKDMEKIMAERFRETYYIVNEAFSSVFKAMFGGGDARLALSYPEDFLLTGIEIVAQPPGKKEQILSLLSGGERAMTAIALLFALLTVKPSPFCILDEIEAALDDVNVDRFARFLRDYTHKTQFIVISHRKGTMEAADVLFGVTMENNGVSRLMSVRLSDYE